MYSNFVFLCFGLPLQIHQLPFTYDFHNYMLRSMEEEFRDIVGIRYSNMHWIFMSLIEITILFLCITHLCDCVLFVHRFEFDTTNLEKLILYSSIYRFTVAFKPPVSTT